MLDGENASSVVLDALRDGDSGENKTDEAGALSLERRETQIREGRRKVTKSVFGLHVIRSTDSGTTYEDTIAYLSESEREVTGLVFALAGYLAHDLSSRCWSCSSTRSKPSIPIASPP